MYRLCIALLAFALGGASLHSQDRPGSGPESTFKRWDTNQDGFWMPSGHTDDYDSKTDPVREGRRVLYLHGTEDTTVPFDGGLRFGKFEHHSAQATANIWAKHFSYTGAERTEEDGTDLGNNLIRAFKFQASELLQVPLRRCSGRCQSSLERKILDRTS